MRVSIFVGVSLDGFLARKNGAYDFLFQKPDVDNGYNRFFASVDALVIGRGTFDVVKEFERWPYAKKLVIVLTHPPRQMRAPAGANCEFIAATPKQVADRLARRGAKHVYVDGGKTIQAFLRAGLIQRMTVTRVPILIGEGIPLFGSVPRDIRLKHVRTRTFRNGMVQTEYRVLRR